MREGWKTIKLDEVCDLITDGVHNSPLYKDEGIPMLDSKHIDDAFNIDDTRPEKFISEDTDKELSKRCKPMPNDVLLSSRGSIGKIAIVKTGQNFNIMGNIILLRSSNKIKPKFLVHSLRSELKRIESISRGVAQKGLYLNQVRNFEIYLPPLPEQQRIVSILEEAFAAINQAKANAEKNLRNAKELFESYLEQAFENKGANWKEKSLDEVCRISSKLVDPRITEFEDLIHIGAGNIESKSGALLDLKTAKEEKLISGKFEFDETMVLYSKIRPYLEKVVRCDFKGLCSADIYPLVPIKDVLVRDFLYYLLLTKKFTQYAILGSQRAGMPKVNREHLFAYEFYLPSEGDQQLIVQKLDALSIETKKLETLYQKKLDDLEELRKSLLDKAFCGELTEKEVVV